MNQVNVPASDPSLKDTTPIRRSAAATLTWGFRATAAILALGLLVTFIGGHDIETEATGFRDIIPDLLDGEGPAIVSLAILTMMLTPVATVIVIALGFLRIGDRRFGRVSLIVLGVLAISIIASFFR